MNVADIKKEGFLIFKKIQKLVSITVTEDANIVTSELFRQHNAKIVLCKIYCT